MQKSWIHYLKELLITQMNHWVLAMAGLTVLSAFSPDKLHLGFLLSLGVIPAYYYLLRLKTKRYFFFITLHFVPFLTLALCKGKLVLFLVTMGILIFYLVYSIKVKVTHSNTENPFIGPCGGVACIALFAYIHNLYGKVDISNYYTIAFFIFLLVYFIYYFMNNYVWFVTVQKNSVDNISEQSLWIGGLKQLLIFIGIALVCMLSLINIEWLSFIVSKLGQFSKFLLRSFLSLIRLEPPTESDIYAEPSSSGMGEMIQNLGHGETATIWVIFEKIAIVATIIFIIWLIFSSLRKFFRFLRTNFYLSKKQTHELTFSGADVREECEIIQTESTLKKLFSFRNNREAARKVYKKFILKHKEALIGNSEKDHLSPLTAGECCEKLDRLEVQELYDKVRYSNEKISPSDVKALKEKTKS